ncbi:MAG: phage holin family protein [Candidatus Peregrinibacteria bacterium]
MPAPSLPTRIVLKAVLNILVVWLMATYVFDEFQLSGGIPACIIVGSLLTLMNLFVRPLLRLITLPLKLFATILSVIIVNGVFVWVTTLITDRMDPALVSLQIYGGLLGWIIVAAAFGMANWIMKELLK